MISIRVGEFKIVTPIKIEVTAISLPNPLNLSELSTDVRVALHLADGTVEYIGKGSKEAEELWAKIYSEFKQKRRVFDYYEETKKE